MTKYGYSVFVGNLSRRARSNEIRDSFRKYGKVIDVDLKNGFGFVEFEDERDAKDAVCEMNGVRMCGERMTVELSKGCRDKYRDFGRTGRVKYRSYSKEMSPARRRRSESRGRSSPKRGDRPHRTRHCLVVENLSSRVRYWTVLALAQPFGPICQIFDFDIFVAGRI